MTSAVDDALDDDAVIGSVVTNFLDRRVQDAANLAKEKLVQMRIRDAVVEVATREETQVPPAALGVQLDSHVLDRRVMVVKRVAKLLGLGIGDLQGNMFVGNDGFHLNLLGGWVILL